VSRYWLDDMVVVQTCCRFRRTILVSRVAAAGGAAKASAEAAAVADAAAFTKLRRFIETPVPHFSWGRPSSFVVCPALN
jgi:hypothetical protein